ncbi:unnamed protein product, partial [Trichogramma brassicae]
MRTWISIRPSRRVHFLKQKLLLANVPTWRSCAPTQGDAVDEIAPRRKTYCPWTQLRLLRLRDERHHPMQANPIIWPTIGFEADFFTPPDSDADNMLCNSPDTEKISGKITDHMRLIGYPCNILMNSTDGNNEKIYFRTNCKFCCFEQRLHRSNNVYYTYDISTGVLYQQCYDVKCKSSIKCRFETERKFWSQVQEKQRQLTERYQIHPSPWNGAISGTTHCKTLYDGSYKAKSSGDITGNLNDGRGDAVEDIPVPPANIMPPDSVDVSASTSQANDPDVDDNSTDDCGNNCNANAAPPIIPLAPLYSENHGFTRKYFPGQVILAYSPESMFWPARIKEVYDDRVKMSFYPVLDNHDLKFKYSLFIMDELEERLSRTSSDLGLENFKENQLELMKADVEREETKEIPKKVPFKDNPEENGPYREAIGSLLYLAGVTRPDIAYAINLLSRRQVAPTGGDFQEVKRILRYLRGTINEGLVYRANESDMEVFTDSSFGDCESSKATSGMFFFIKNSFDIAYDNSVIVHYKDHSDDYLMKMIFDMCNQKKSAGASQCPEQVSRVRYKCLTVVCIASKCFNANVVSEKGLYNLKIQGQVCHSTPSKLYTEKGEIPKNGQIYIYDDWQATEIRLQNHKNLVENNIKEITKILNKVNPYSKKYKNFGLGLSKGHITSSRNHYVILTFDRNDHVIDRSKSRDHHLIIIDRSKSRDDHSKFLNSTSKKKQIASKFSADSKKLNHTLQNPR